MTSPSSSVTSSDPTVYETPTAISSTGAHPIASTTDFVLETCEEIVRERIPNLFRLYLNPYVAQACHCLTMAVVESWPPVQLDAQKESELLANWVAGTDPHALQELMGSTEPTHQVFLANSGDEALSGAVKLARYACNAEERSPAGLLFDPHDRWRHFADSTVTIDDRDVEVTFIPEIDVVHEAEAFNHKLATNRYGFVIVPHSELETLYADGPQPDEIPPTLIVVSDRNRLFAPETSYGPEPDLIVLGEDVVDEGVPFGAFIGTKTIFRHWNRKGMATFHSTTYQPNTIASLHLLRVLAHTKPDFLSRHQAVLDRIKNDLEFRTKRFAELYSPQLVKLTRTVGFDHPEPKTDGAFVEVRGGRLYDGVAGVACSVRGHNPPEYAAEMRAIEGGESAREELHRRLHEATGLPHAVPAVSGASAVEQGLKLALAACSPNDYVLAMRGGFGGKTLVALTGTWKPSLRSGLTPLYPNVVYVDPFASDVVEQIRAAFETYPIGVMQTELVQGVGGVRPIPKAVLEELAQQQKGSEAMLFVDEVQTGMFRTGPLLHSTTLGVEPDVVSMGKATSDMMYPYAFTLYSERLADRLAKRNCDLPERLQARHTRDLGTRSVLNTLRRAEQEGLSDHVRTRGEQFAQRLRERFARSRRVRDVRCFGLLIGIELSTAGPVRKRLGKLLGQMYLLRMMQHEPFPLLVGFCQYEPNILKLTPPLTISESETEQVCETLGDVLDRPLPAVALQTLWQTRFRSRS